jgi:HD-GYP domain-containing protein (c-di-GMP phosphodiesterase class II)
MWPLAISHQAAMVEIEHSTGKQFDPTLVAKFTELMRSRSGPVGSGDIKNTDRRSSDENVPDFVHR